MAKINTTPEPNERFYGRLQGVRYWRFLRRMHQALKPEWYLEVGTATGGSLRQSSGNAICVDPNFRIKENVFDNRKECHFFQMTSDDFFAADRIRPIAGKIEMAFLDGMHLFEFLLRDFVNTEKHMSKEGVIVLHDCIPMTPVATEREWDRSRTRNWTGDVWKMVPILNEWRPDLNVTIFDCPPSGLVVIKDLAPRSKVLEKNYEKIVEKYTEMSVFDYGVDALYDLLDPQPSEDSKASVTLVGR